MKDQAPSTAVPFEYAKGSDRNVSLLRGSISRTLGHGVNLITMFYTMPVVINALGIRWYGIWSLVGDITTYYSYLDFGVSSATQVFISYGVARKRKDEIMSVLNTSFLIFLAVGLVASIISVVIGLSSSFFLDDPVESNTFRNVMFILAVSPPFVFSSLSLNGLFTATLRYDMLTAMDSAKLVVKAALILLIAQIGLDIVALAWLTVGTDIVFCFIKYFFANRVLGGISLRFRSLDRKRTRELYSYGYKALFAQSAEILKFRLDGMVIASFINVSSVAVYNVGGQLARHLRRLVGVIINIMIPVYAQQHANRDWEAIQRTFILSSKISMTLCTVLASGTILFADVFIDLWMGRTFSQAYVILLILGLASLFQVSVQPIVNLVFALAKHGTYAGVSLLEGLLNLVFSLILVQWFGSYGVAWGTAIPMAGSTIWLIFHGLKIIDKSFGYYFRNVAPIVFSGGITALAASALLQKSRISSYMELALLAAVTVGVQALVIVFVAFKKEEREIIFSACVRLVRGAHA